MAGFNQPQRHMLSALVDAAFQAGLSPRQQGGQLFLSRFGHRVHVRQDAGQWWVDAPNGEAVGPIEDEDALMVAAAEVLDTVSARSRQTLVQGR
ncbi:hypothetical protein [Nocardiopsis alborubida]|uniref:Uncharacterized protein n=1 Tax=Nocardiopsis alborubida TaxID=146802 RepID=A0A7X6MBL6_9ACTN|nr:hypothetical protein [Nocardiopsis alborubida]NKY96750.1 hypothetical protein [Nocardiopsis alborubida]